MAAMPDDDWTPSGSYWVIAWATVRTYVDPEQAEHARKQFESGAAMIEVEDIFGSTNWIPAAKLDGLWDSTPQMRERSARTEQMLKAETGYREE